MGSMHASRTLTTMPNNTAHLLPVLYPIQHPRRQMHPLAGARTTRLIGKESSSPKQTQGKILYYDLIICERDGREEYK